MVFHQRSERDLEEDEVEEGSFGEWVVRVWEVIEVMFGYCDEVVGRK